MINARSNLRDMDWNLLKTFHVIVKSGNLTKAGKKLSRKQPAVSLALRRFEELLGVKLCKRSSSRFELTSEGLRVWEICDEIFSSVQEISNGESSDPLNIRDNVRIAKISNTTSDNFDAAVSSFHQQCPFVRIEIDVVAWEQVDRLLFRREIDLGVASVSLQRSDFSYSLIDREIHRLYCGRNHPLFGKTVKKLSNLSKEGFVLTGSDESHIIANFRKKHGLGRSVAGVSEFLNEAKKLTVNGVGLCFLPEKYVANEVKENLLKPVLPQEIYSNLDVFVIAPPVDELKLSVRILYNHLVTKQASF